MIQLLLILICRYQTVDILELKGIWLKVDLSDGLDRVQDQSVCDVEGVGADIYFFQLHTVLFKVN